MLTYIWGNIGSGNGLLLDSDRHKAITWTNVDLSSGYINLEDEFESEMFKTTAASPRDQWVNSLWPSDAIWWQRSGSTLVQLMACCLTTPSQYWTSVDLSSARSSDIFLGAISQQLSQPSIIVNWLEKCSSKISLKSLRDQWVSIIVITGLTITNQVLYSLMFAHYLYFSCCDGQIG